MSHIERLIGGLESNGAKFWIDGDKLRYTAPHGVMTPTCLAQIKERKPELIEYLGSRGHGNGDESRTRHSPASFAQLRFWTLQNQNSTAAFYNVPFAFRLRGALDTAKLRESLNAVVRRHEILRTTLHEIDGKLTQVIAPAGEMDLTFTQGSVEAESWLKAEMERPFDLAVQAGLRAALIQLSGEEQILQFCFHNTVFDQDSLLTFLDDLSWFYSALLAGEPLNKPQPNQYREFVEWHDSCASRGMEQRLRYWQEWFTKAEPPRWNWLPSKPAPLTPSFHTHTPRQRFSPELTRQLKELSGRNGVTLYITLLAAYAILLRRYTGCADITTGTTHSNRTIWNFAHVMGPAIDVPALRINTAGNPRLADLLVQVRSVLSAALEYQDVPWALMAPKLSPPRQADGPLFRMVFSFFPATPHERLRLPGIEVAFLEHVVNSLSRPDLYLVLWENKTAQGEMLTGYWMHKRDVFDLETAERMNCEWTCLLSEIVKQPDANVEALLSSL